MPERKDWSAETVNECREELYRMYDEAMNPPLPPMPMMPPPTLLDQARSMRVQTMNIKEAK